MNKQQSKDNERLTDEARKIKRLIAASMDGVTAEKMRRNGIGYAKNLGVALPRLREIAAMFAPDANLAATLWKTGSRETMIAALLLTPPDSLTVGEAERLAEQLPTNELTEIAAAELFAKMPNAAEFVDRMSQKGAKGLFVACCTATHATDRLDDTLLERLAQEIGQSDLDLATASAASTLFTRLGETPTRKNCVTHAIETLRKSPNALCQRIAEWLSY